MTVGSMTAAELRDAVVEAAPSLRARAVGAIEGLADTLVLRFAGAHRLCLVVRFHRDATGLYTSAAEPEGRRLPLASPELAHAIVEAHLKSIACAPSERFVTLEFTGSRGSLRLRFKLFPRRPNWILTGADGRVIALGAPERSTHRVLTPGETDTLPRARDGARPEPPSRFPAPGDGLDTNRAIEAHFRRLDASRALETGRSITTKDLDRRLRSRQARIEGLRRSLDEAAGFEALTRRAVLLSCERHRIPRGATSVRVVDTFDAALPEVEIALDPGLDVGTQAERLFAKARRMRLSIPRTEAELTRTLQEIAILEAARREAEACQDLDCLAALRRRLEDTHHLTRAAQPRGASPPRERRAAPFHRFRSKDGFEIRVGRSAEENQALTFGHARGSDLWLHVGQASAGAHVVVCVPSGRSVPLETLLDAATLAVHFSKARGASRAEVLAVSRKFVTRRRGAPPGSVLVAGERRLTIDRDRARLERLLSGNRPELGSEPPPPSLPRGDDSRILE